MATYDTTTHPLAFAHMEGGMKTVYVVPNSGELSMVTSGDRVEFDDLGYITIGTVRRYETLNALIEAEGFSNVIPEADSPEEAIEALRGSVDWNGRSEDNGVLALRVRNAKRKS
jgi:ASC-1-like (ASCH) protein